MAHLNYRLQLLAACAALSNFISLTACDDSSTGQNKGSEEVEEVSATKSLYAVMYEVFSADGNGSDSYLSVFDSLDIKEIDTQSAREFPGGRAYLQSYNKWVFVGEPSAPNILRFTVGENGKLEQDGTLDLGNYGLMDGSIDDWGINFISPTKAYFFTLQEGVTVIWNPSTMEITGEIPAPENYVREGLMANNSPAVQRGDRLYRAIYWEEEDAPKHPDAQQLIVIDTKNDEIVESSEDKRCPAPGNRAFVAEDGTIYFSNWIWGAIEPLLYDGPKTCILRVLPDAESYDPDWSLEFSEVADGREGGMFTYVADGQGVMSIFHDEEVERDETTDPYEYVSNVQWETWTVDLEKRSGAPLQGIPLNTGAYTPVTLDKRLFLMVPEASWEGTQLYEVSGDHAEPYVRIPGWSYMFQKIR